MDGSVLEKKSYFKILELSKTASKKIGVLIRSLKFLSPEVALYLYKFTIRRAEHCCHVRNGYVGPSLDAFLEPLAHCRNVTRLSLFNRYFFGRCSSEQSVPIRHSRGMSTRFSNRLHDSSVIIPRYYEDVDVNSFTKQIICLQNEFFWRMI